MVVIEIVIKTLLITKVCLSLTIYQPSYINYKGRRTLTIDQHYSLPQIVHTKNSSVKSKSAQLSQAIQPYKAGAIADALSHTTFVAYKQPGYSNIYPVQYQFNKPVTATHPKLISVVANEQPVTATSSESEILHEPRNEAVLTHQRLGNGKPTSTVNYTHETYHINTHERKASPLANIEQQKNPEFVVRNQRNLKENHDDKLIEQKNIKEIKYIKYVNDVNDQQNSTTASSPFSSSSIKQPSSKVSLTSSEPTTMKTPHEIRYLHDIFLNYPKSYHVNSGHVELSPNLFEKRFESQKAGNRYKGEV